MNTALARIASVTTARSAASVAWVRSVGSAASVALAALAALVALGACRRTPGESSGRRHGCLCTYLTDFDDSARIEIDVCVPASKPTLEVAATCASDASRNPAESCTCGPPGEACDPSAPGACRNR